MFQPERYILATSTAPTLRVNLSFEGFRPVKLRPTLRPQLPWLGDAAPLGIPLMTPSCDKGG